MTVTTAGILAAHPAVDDVATTPRPGGGILRAVVVAHPGVVSPDAMLDAYGHAGTVHVTSDAYGRDVLTWECW